MDSQVNLSDFSAEECQQILSVIQRDFNLRQQEQQRLEELESEIKQEKLRSEILSKGQAFNENCCVRCISQFYMFFNPKVQCAVCTFNVCKKCSVYNGKEKKYVCSLCTKQEEFEALSNKWFYSNVAERFDRFGSANVVRMFHKKKTDSDVDSDSGYPPTDSSTVGNVQPSLPLAKSTADMQQATQSTASTETDGRDNILASFRQRLDQIEKSIQLLHHEEEDRQNSDQPNQNQFSQISSLDQNMTNVKTLLMSLARQLASNLNSADGGSETVNLEHNDAVAKRLLQDAVNQLYSHSSSSSSTSKPKNADEPFAFIDPSSLTLDAYAKRLSEAIFNKINEDLHCSGRKQDGEQECDNIEFQRRSEMTLLQTSRFSDSEMEDLRATTDSNSDVDVQEPANFWPHKSADFNQSQSESHSRMSLNSSQNEFEGAVQFIESEDLAEKLAALSRSDLAPALNGCDDGEKQFLHQSDDGNRSIGQSNDGNRSIGQSGGDVVDSLHQSRVEKQSSASLSGTSAEMESPRTSAQTQVKVETSAELSEGELKRKILVNSGFLDATTKGDASEDDEDASIKVSKYDIEEYAVTPGTLSDFVSRKRDLFVLPGLDDDDSISRSSDIDLDLTSGHGSDHSFGTWSFRHVPVTPHGSFRRNKRGASNGSWDDPPSIFLPQRFPPEDPIIGSRNASEISNTDSLSDVDNVSDLDEEEQRKQLWYTESIKRNGVRLAEDEKKQNQPQDSYAQTDETVQDNWESDRAAAKKNNQTDSGVQTFDDELRSDAGSDFPDADESLKPRFEDVLQNVIVSVGQSFRSKAFLSGKKPIDVFWFHESLRLDFDERCTIACRGSVFSLEMIDVKTSDDGHYVCIGVNEHGRCSQTFHVNVIDPETFQQSEHQRFITTAAEKKEKEHNEWQRKPRTAEAAVGSVPDSVTEMHSFSLLQPDWSNQGNSPPPATPPSSSDVASSNVASSEIALLSSEDAVDSVVRDLATTPKNEEQGTQKAASVEVSEVDGGGDDDFAASVRHLDEMLMESTSPSSSSIVEKKIDLNLGRPSADVPDSAVILQAFSFLNHEHYSPDVEPDDGKVDLQLSFSDFERLYESRAMTPSQLKSGRFTPEEVLRIQSILGAPDKTDVGEGNNSGSGNTTFPDDFDSKKSNVKASLYGRDYVVIDAVDNANRLNYRRTNSGSVSSCDETIALSPTPSKVPNAKAPISCPPASEEQRKVALTSAQNSKKHASSSDADVMSRSAKESTTGNTDLGLTKDSTSKANTEKKKANNGDAAAAADDDDNVSQASSQASSELDEMNLPSVRSLRKLFSAASSEDSNFTRVYSLTARDLPNSVIAQRSLAKKMDKRTLKQQLSNIPEPSEDQKT